MRTMQKGFTLIELVVVIVILGILSAVAIPKFVDLRTEATAATVKGVAGGLDSANALNTAGCMVLNNVPTTDKCVPLKVGATTKCSSIGTLMTPAITFTVGALPTPTVQGTYYIVTDSALTIAGTACTLVMGDGTNSGVTQTYTGTATGT